MDLTKDNYLRGTGTGNTWHVDIDPPKRKVKSYFEETLITAEDVYANKTGKLHLFFSGGMDSQYVFNVFEYLKFDFTPVIVRYTGKYYHLDYNYHDTVYAFEYCKSKNIKPLVIELDFDDFVKSGEMFDIMREVKCGVFGLPSIMKAATLIDGFTVLGDAPPYIKYNENNNSWYHEEAERFHSILTFYRTRKLNGCPFILNYSAEMVLSFYLDPTIVDLANNKFPGKKGTHSSKSYVYNNGSGFNISHYDYSSHKRVKMHGYEVIEKSSLLKIPEMFEFSPRNPSRPWNGYYYEEYHKLVNRLSIHQS